jgi:hypothetical protein
MTLTQAQVEALAAGSAGLAFRGRGAVEVMVLGQACAPLDVMQALAALVVAARVPAPVPSAKKGRA